MQRARVGAVVRVLRVRLAELFDEGADGGSGRAAEPTGRGVARRQTRVALPETRDGAASSRTSGSAERLPLHLLRELGERLVEALVRRGGEGGSEDAALPRRGPRPAAARPPRRRGDAPGRIAEEDERAARGAPSGRDVLTIGARQRSAPSRGWHPPRGRASDASGIPHRAAGLRPRATRRAPRAVRRQTHLTVVESMFVDARRQFGTKSRVRSRFVRHGVLINHFAATAYSPSSATATATVTQLRRRLRPPHTRIVHPSFSLRHDQLLHSAMTPLDPCSSRLEWGALLVT